MSDPYAASSVTVEDLRRAIERAAADEHERIIEQNGRWKQFMEAVPEEHRDHPEILRMASIAASGQPIHPRDRDALQARYEEIVGDVTNVTQEVRDFPRDQPPMKA